jgi:dipeptidase E
MKFFLTSSGLTTETLRNAFRAILPSDPRVVFVPTAAKPYPDTSWLKDDIENVRLAGVTVDLLDISTASRDEWFGSIEAADAICFGGGNTYFLLEWVRRCGLASELPVLLQDKVYMGISAGSMIAGPSIESNSPIFPEEDDGITEDRSGLSLVPFAVVPHLNSPSFPRSRAGNIRTFAAGVPYPVYALDDRSAIEFVDGRMRVVSTGEYQAYNNHI